MRLASRLFSFSVIALVAGSVLAAGTVIASPEATVDAGVGDIRVSVSFAGARPIIESARGAVRVTVDGCISGIAPGAPDLPAYLLRVELPVDMKVNKLDWRILESVPVEGKFELSLAPAPVSTDPGGKQPTLEEVEFDENEWFPVSAVSNLGDDFLRGHRIAGFLVYPTQYKKVSGEVRFLERVDFTMELVPDTRLPLERKRHVDRAELEFADVVRSLVVNPEYSGRERGGRPATPDALRAPEEDSFAPTFRPSLDGSPVEYVIITNEEMTLEFQRLAEWQTKMGVPTVVRTVSWIEANYFDGCDLAETIRRFIQDAYANWGTVWILLGGDSDVIPARYGFSTYTGGEYIPTDLYYQCLDRNWNGDGDANFGEGYHGSSDVGDNADLYPEVWLGRAPVNTTEEAQLFVDKTLAYVKSPEPNLVSTSLFFCEVLFPKTYVPSGTKCDTVALDGAEMAETSIAFMPPSMGVTKLYENYLCYPGSFSETKEKVIDSLNVGYGLAVHIGHGYRNSMGVATGTLSNSEVDLLTNGSRVGVVMGENCTSAAFDFNCIGERFVLNENGGSVCYEGSTRFDYPTTAWSFQDERFRILFQQGITNMGKALAMSKATFVPLAYADDSFRWTEFVQVLLGEPYMPMWTAEPQTLSVAHASEFEAGSDWFEVTVTSGGSPVDSAMVCLWKVDESYRVAYTDPTGVAQINLSPDTPGSFSVTVTKQNFIPYEGTADVVMPSGPYLYKYAEDFDDNDVGLSFGNGDYKVDAGETIELTVALRNSGSSTASSVTATMRTDDPVATFLDSTASFGNIPAGGFAPADTAFLVSISRDCPDAYEVICTVEARDQYDSVWTDVLLIKVHAPKVWHASHACVDTLPGGNGDGYVDPGEQIELVVTLKNLGWGSAYQVNGKLTSPSPNITIYDSLATFGSILPCSSSTGDRFMFVMSVEEIPVFYLTLTDTLGLNQVTQFELVRPPYPQDLFATGSASSVTLTWSPTSASDLHGYHVYRSSVPGGPYVRVNEALIERTSYYLDVGLLPYTRYYYKVSAQDSSANEAMSITYASVTTNPPLHENAPFELGTELTSSSPVIVDADKSGDIEIFLGSNKIYAFKHNGDEYIDGDNDVLTHGVFAPEGGKYACAPAVADIDNDDVVEIVAVDWSTKKAYVWNSDGSVQAGWPRDVGVNPWSTPALGNIAGDSRLEIVVGSGDGKVYAWNADGTEVVDGDGNPSTIGVLKVTGSLYLYGSAALADIDSDGLDEVIIGARDGLLYALNGDGTSVPHFPYVTTGYITNSPAVADVDDDGQPEIVFASANFKVYAINMDSTLVPGWPKSGINMSGDMQPSPAIGDLNGDGKLDVVIGTCNGYVYAWKGHDGTPITGWPVLASTLGSQCSPTLGDIDGDGMLEVLFGAENGKLYAWNHDGTEASGFPIQMTGEVRGPALIWDVDDDGYTNVVCQNWDRTLYIWDMNGPFSYTRASYPWPMFRHDAARSGVYTKPVLTAVELSAFVALPSDVGLVVEWRTDLDDVAGSQWNIYRKDSGARSPGDTEQVSDEAVEGGQALEGYVQLNSDPIMATSPNYYRFTDVTAVAGNWYSYMLGRIHPEGEVYFGPFAVFAPASSVPGAPALSQNFPNPFQPRTTVSFSVPALAAGATARTPVSIRVFDVAGRLVKTLVDEPKASGFYSVYWNATSDAGTRVAGGVYFIRADIGDFSATRKTVVLD